MPTTVAAASMVVFATFPTVFPRFWTSSSILPPFVTAAPTSFKSSFNALKSGSVSSKTAAKTLFPVGFGCG